MTFQDFILIKNEEWHNEHNKYDYALAAWDSGYSEGYSKAIQDYIKSHNMAQFYDREKQL